MKLDIAHRTFDVILCKTRIDKYRIKIFHDGMKKPAWFHLPSFSVDRESIKLKTLEAFYWVIDQMKQEYQPGKARNWLQLDWVDLAAIDTVLSEYLQGIIPRATLRINGNELPHVDLLSVEFQEKTWALKPDHRTGA
jgi:hypothetical protein